MSSVGKVVTPSALLNPNRIVSSHATSIRPAGAGANGVGRLILLCHKFRCLFRAAQHGQRESVVARAATNLRRIVAIEFGTWRSGRNGGSSGLVTFAYGNLRAQRGGTIS